jgi:hypothetical protein
MTEFLEKPQTEEEKRAIEEIVSPVQPMPQGRFSATRVFGVLALIVVVFGLGYLTYGQWPSFRGGIKVANAPEGGQGQGQDEGVLRSVPTPSPAEPRVSSITTTDSNVPERAHSANSGSPTPTPVAAQTSRVAGESAANKPRVYTHATGFAISLPARVSVAESSVPEQVVAFYGSSGQLLARAQVSAFLLDGPAALGEQLALSPSVASLQPVYRSSYTGYSYSQNGTPALALVRGNLVYYFADYSGSLINSFMLY